MTNDELEDKIGAMHQQLLHDEEQYCTLLGHLCNYYKDNKHYGKDVLTALADGLDNQYRYQKIENALSPRHIRIEKRSFREGQGLNANDTEGAYRLIFHFDDEKEECVHFKRKQEQLLYMLILLSSLKNGYTSEFLKCPVNQQVKKTFVDLARIIYPKEHNIEDIIINLDPDVYFTETVQKMKSAINKLLTDSGKQLEAHWFVPYTLNVKRGRVYQIHMEPTKIILPEEFKTIVSQLPLSDAYVDMSSFVSVEMQRENNEKLIKDAQSGDVKSINQLALAYMQGIGRMVDLPKAFSLYKQTADLGDAEGLYWVGVFYGTGHVVSQDYAISTMYFQKSAEKGYQEAIYWLGKYKMHGFGCKTNWKEALKYFKTAADNGSAEAANEVGYIYDRGEHGIKKDDNEAFKWFLKAAKLNHIESIRYVIRAYHEGLVNDKNQENYKYWIEKAFELDDPKICLQVGYFLYEGGNYESAFPLLEAASEAGHITANYSLAFMLVHGYGVKADEERAIEYLRQGALLGDKTCQDILKRAQPQLWEEICPKIEEDLDMLDLLKKLIEPMAPNHDYFFLLTDNYRQYFHEDYLKEINKQLSIHQPSTAPDNHVGRKIIVRKSSSKKAHYEVIVTLINGKEKILKLNPNSLILLLLTIICSYKSGYTTVMTLDTTCRSVMLALVKLVLGISEEKGKEYISKYMTSPQRGTDNYKIYSNDVKRSIKSAIGEYDEVTHFLFDNKENIGRRPLRSMNLSPQNIELPEELRKLAGQMPDGKKILYSLEDERIIDE